MNEKLSPWFHAIRNTEKTNDRGPDFLRPEAMSNVRRIHEGLPVYKPTPLARLDGLAHRLGVKAVFVKDESKRFGLNAFKGLGGLYALTRVVCRELGLDGENISFSRLQSPELAERVHKFVFVTATDGNHGKGIAWAASQLGCEAHVYMPRGSSELRAQAIRNAGAAEVRILEVGYDDAVRYAAAQAKEHGWFLVQDTSWDGYEEEPRWIIQGYTTMAAEAARQLSEAGFEAPTHVFLQAGVGAMSGGVMGYLANLYEGHRPVFGVVEPENAACIYRSALMGDGKPHAATGNGVTIMAGLNCGEPCTVTWPVLRDFADWYYSCPDFVAAYGMRLLGAPSEGDPQVISGESGAATTGLFALLSEKEECAALKEETGLNEDSVVLLFSTEGNTDPVNYDRIVHGGSWALPC